MPPGQQIHWAASRSGRTGPGELAVCAFSLVGPRNRVDKITKKLALLP